MRVDFTQAVSDFLAQDERGVFVTGDLGYNAFEKLSTTLGRRFLNAGVAEQNMIGAAAGMALAGYRPWVYSIAPFATYRCFEQIRNDVCLHNLPVRIVGNGGGYTYGIMGSTHHALEDLGILKTLPNMSLFFPGTNGQVAACVSAMNELSAPSYLRLSISGFGSNAAPLSENRETLTRHYSQGSRLTVIGVGHAVQPILVAGIPDADVFGLCRFPFNWASDKALRDSIEKTGRVLVIDEHYASGSIGESLRMLLPRGVHFELMSAQYSAGLKYGSPAFHLKQSGLAPEDILKRATARWDSGNTR